MYLITGLDYWTGTLDWTTGLINHAHLFVITCFILKSKQAIGLKLCNLIENMLLYKMGKFVQTVWLVFLQKQGK